MRVILIALVLSGCGSAPLAPDLGAIRDLSQDVSPLEPPAGFGTACTSSTDCHGYAQDQAPGFLGCESYIGVDYCTRPCDPTHPCWTGTSCTCAMRTNVSGLPETDCYCARP